MWPEQDDASSAEGIEIDILPTDGAHFINAVEFANAVNRKLDEVNTQIAGYIADDQTVPGSKNKTEINLLNVW